MATQLTPFQISLRGSTWIDVNTLLSINNLPDRLGDVQCITHGSLVNLLNCPIGGRSRTFQPRYGTILYHILQEPLDEESARALQIGLIQAIARWEPRIKLDFSQTYVVADHKLPGYKVRLSFVLLLNKEYAIQDFDILLPT